MTSAPSPIHDPVRALHRMGGDLSLYREMAQLLLEDGPDCLAELRAAVQREDFSRAHDAAHTLKGLAGNFDAARALAAAATVQRAALAEQPVELRQGSIALEQAFSELASALGRELERPPDSGA